MRNIEKNSEPASLAAHRQESHSNFDNYKSKDELRTALVREQKGLCCYCMRRIEASKSAMKIEHWRCQAQYEELQLVYGNLLGACSGGAGLPAQFQHCDTLKGDFDLRWNPADPTHQVERRIRYELDGTITSDDADFDVQLNKVLGLNLPALKNQRKAKLDSMARWWRREKARLQGPVPPNRLARERANHAHSAGTLAPFSPVVVWWLDQRIKKSAQ